jgi:hypothetical protein
VAESCEHDDERLGSIKFWDNLEQLSNQRVLEKDSAPWS